MAGLTLTREIRNGGRQFIGRDERVWDIARRAIGNERASAWRADDGQCGGRRMGAALGAAGNVNGERAAEMRRGRLRDCGRDGARGNVRGRTDRRAGASDDMAARVVGANDKAKPLGGGEERGRHLWCESDDHEYAAWCGAQSDGAGGAASFGQAFERRRVAMTEGKAKPVRQ